LASPRRRLLRRAYHRVDLRPPEVSLCAREETHLAIETFVLQTLGEGFTPVLLAYTLGKSQETMQLLSQAGFSVAVHSSIAQIATLYGELGHPLNSAALKRSHCRAKCWSSHRIFCARGPSKRSPKNERPC